MPKKIRFESAKYQTLLALERLTKERKMTSAAWRVFLDNLDFRYVKGDLEIYYPGCSGKPYSVLLKQFGFYTRGDRDPEAWGDADTTYDRNKILAFEIAEGLVELFSSSQVRYQK